MQKLLWMIILLGIVISGCANTESNRDIELTVSAASSLTDSLMEIKDAFEKENPHVQITYNFGGTGTLRRQIEEGAPVDLFFSASEKDYESLVDDGFVKEGAAILSNRLVVIKSKSGDVQSLASFNNHQGGAIAIGTPETVPAGAYAKQALKKMGYWKGLEEQIVLTKDVHQVLTLVSEEAAEIGIVYSSDLHRSDEVVLLENIDRAVHSPITYYIANIEDQHIGIDKMNAKQNFFEFAQGEKAKEIFEKNGFEWNGR